MWTLCQEHRTSQTLICPNNRSIPTSSLSWTVGSRLTLSQTHTSSKWEVLNSLEQAGKIYMTCHCTRSCRIKHLLDSFSYFWKQDTYVQQHPTLCAASLTEKVIPSSLISLLTYYSQGVNLLTEKSLSSNIRTVKSPQWNWSVSQPSPWQEALCYLTSPRLKATN